MGAGKFTQCFGAISQHGARFENGGGLREERIGAENSAGALPLRILAVDRLLSQATEQNFLVATGRLSVRPRWSEAAHFPGR